jgi:RNA polymerase sigma factor (sigma-70 family)
MGGRLFGFNRALVSEGMSHAELVPLPSPRDPGIPPCAPVRPERLVPRRPPPVVARPDPEAHVALSRQACEGLLLSHLHTINRIAAAGARRSRLRADEVEDFAAIVRLRFIQNDYAILRQYRQRSALATFLTVVINRMLLDYCRSRWGRWRPTVKARRQGAVATLLEQLTTRDGLTVDEAAHLIGTAAGDLTPTCVESPAFASGRPRLVSLDAAINVATPRTDYDERALCGDSLRRATQARKALAMALKDLAPTDRTLLALRFVSGLSVADIARALSTPQKPLYRQIDRLLARMRAELELAGVSAEDVTTP